MGFAWLGVRVYPSLAGNDGRSRRDGYVPHMFEAQSYSADETAVNRIYGYVMYVGKATAATLQATRGGEQVIVRFESDEEPSGSEW